MEGRELLQRFRYSGTPWTAVATDQLRRLLDCWIISGQPVNEAMALQDLMCQIDRGESPSLNGCAKRWGWTTGVTRKFLEGHGLLKERIRNRGLPPGQRLATSPPELPDAPADEPLQESADPVENGPSSPQQGSGEARGTQAVHSAYTGGTQQTANSTQNQGVGTRVVHGAYTGGTSDSTPDYIKDQKEDSPSENQFPPNPPGGVLGQSAELARVIAQIREMPNTLQTGEVVVRLERHLRDEGFETRRNARVEDAGAGKPGSINLQASLGGEVLSVQVCEGAVRSQAVLKLRNAEGLKLLIVRSPRESLPETPPTGIDLVVNAGQLLEIAGDPELGFLTLDQIGEIDPRIRDDPAVIERWKVWVEWRRRTMKIPVDAESAKLNLKKLKEAPTSAAMIEWIDTGIQHAWRGIFEPKTSRTPRNGTHQRRNEASGAAADGRGGDPERSRAEREADREAAIRRQFGIG